MKQMAAMAQKDPNFKKQAVELLTGVKKLSPEAVALLEGVAASSKDDIALRGKAARTLAGSEGKESLEASVRVFAAIGGEGNGELKHAREDFIHEGKRTAELAYFKKLAIAEDAGQRELAYAVLTVLANNNRNKEPLRADAAAAIEQGWAKPVTAASLLRAIGQTRFNAYAEKVRAHLKDSNAAVQQAATYAAKEMKLIVGGGPVATAKTMAEIPYDEALATAPKIKGDIALGQQMFLRQGCVACHTVNQTDPPKGPFLGDIGARNKPDELIESILKPNAKIAQGFQTFFFELKNKDRKEGFITKEGGEEIELRDITGALTTIQVTEIAKRGKLETSVMPEGIAGNMTMQEFASLLAYLESLKGK
jgi:putative heme-binding domain-containing protein